MAKEKSIKAIILEEYGLDVSGRAMKIFQAEFQQEGETMLQTNQRIRRDVEAFYQFLVERTDIPLRITPNSEVMNHYLLEIDFIGRSIVTLKNYSAGNDKIKAALPELVKIYNDYSKKVKELAVSLNLPENFASKRIRSKHLDRLED